MIKNNKEIEKKLASLVITALLTITAFLTLPIVRAPFVPSGDITPAVWEITTDKWVGGQPSGYKEGDTAAMGTLMTVGAGEWIINVTLQVYESPFTNAYGFTDFEPWDLTVTPPFLFDGNRHDAGIDVDGTYGTGWDNSHQFIWFYNATVVEVSPDPYAPTLGYAGADPNYIGVSVTFTKAHDGPCWMLYGGHLASFGDPLPAGSPEAVVNGIVDLNEGAHFMTGVFQSRIKGAGDKTINFKGGNLINIDYKPLIQVIKDGPATAGIGEEITYYFNVSHAPGSDCSPVTITSVIDNVSGNAVYISGDLNNSGKLDCGETWLYTATYTILASDPSPLKNLVNASGTDEDGDLVYDNDTHELTIENYPPIITTLLSDDSITIGDSITDTVTFTGLASITPTEAIIFQYQAPGESTWTTYDTQTLIADGPGIWTATSIAFTPDQVGTWYFRATYPGDNHYSSNASGDTAEVLGVGRYTSSVTTLLSKTTIILGESLTDSVTFTGLAGYTPTESIIFQHKAPGESTWTTYDSQTLTPAGSGVWTATSIAFTPDEVGTWYFRAYYPGDSNYNPKASGETAEVLAVDYYTPSITTLLSKMTIILGESLTDTVTFTGLTGFAPTESIIFQHKAPGESTWTTFDSQALIADGPGVWTATSILFTPNEVGTWYFRATYPGDSHYNSNASGDTAEVLDVGCYTPTITTLLSQTTILLGESLTDTVTFTGLAGYTPTETIIFQHKAPGESTWTTYDSQTLTPAGSGVWTATSIAFTPDEVGTWYFRAYYPGDDNYCSNASGDTAEVLDVGCYTPSITTLLSDTTITLGESLTDTATFIGLAAYTPTEPITFQHKAPGEITWTTYDTQPLTPAGSGIWTVTSISFTPNEVGTWYFRATYPGDDNYCANASGDIAEVLGVGYYTPSITTLLSDESIAYEESVTDTVTFIGLEGYTPTNMIVFQHKAPGEITWTTFDSQPLIADGPGIWTATSIPFIPDKVGTWYFRAFYYGDDNYSSNHSADESEPLIVSAQPGIHIDKTADKLIIYPGEDITYYFWVNNSGNVRLQITSLEDDVLGDLLTNPEVQLTGDSDNDGWIDTTEHWIYSLTQHWNQTTTMFTLSLPTFPVIINVVNGTVSYYDLTLSGVPDGYDVTNGHFISWCIQRDTIMPRNKNHNVTLYSSYDPDLPDIVKDYEWPQINYILNHKNGYDKTAIQEAIWFLTDQKSTTNPDALDLLQEANEFGADFEPYVDQIIAVIAIGSPLIQRVIFEVTLPDYPITNNVSIEAVDPFGTLVSSNDSLTVMVEGE